jgi:hypothetical protein
LTAGRLSRRTAVGAFGGGAAAVLLARSRGLAAPGQGGSAIDFPMFQNSGPALGMTRDDWFAAIGEGDRVDGGIDGDLYEYGTQMGMLYVSFRAINDDFYASYIEFAFGGNGLTYDRVEPIVREMMPGDARATGSYLAPATPAGPTAIASWSYVSEELATRPGFSPEFLSMRLQERGADNAWLVSSAILVAGDIMQ